MSDQLRTYDTVSALSAHTGLSVYFLRQLIRENKLPYIKSGKKILINTARALSILDHESISELLVDEG